MLHAAFCVMEKKQKVWPTYLHDFVSFFKQPGSCSCFPVFITNQTCWGWWWKCDASFRLCRRHLIFIWEMYSHSSRSWKVFERFSSSRTLSMSYCVRLQLQTWTAAKPLDTQRHQVCFDAKSRIGSLFLISNTLHFAQISVHSRDDLAATFTNFVHFCMLHNSAY